MGFAVESSRVTEMLIAVGAAFVPFLGITYSLLFLVVQFGSTTFTPRLNLFRDSAIVWHGFSYFTAVIVFSFTAAFAVGKAEQTTALIPALVIVIVVGAIGVFRSLQSSAFKSIQLASTLAAVRQRGRQVVDGVYPNETLEPPAAAPREVVEGEVLWPGPAATLQAIDVPALLRCAERMGVVIELCVQPGKSSPTAVVLRWSTAPRRTRRACCCRRYERASSGRSTRTGHGASRSRRYCPTGPFPGRQRPDDRGRGTRWD